jgi:hypothetical protein
MSSANNMNKKRKIEETQTSLSKRQEYSGTTRPKPRRVVLYACQDNIDKVENIYLKKSGSTGAYTNSKLYYLDPVSGESCDLYITHPESPLAFECGVYLYKNPKKADAKVVPLVSAQFRVSPGYETQSKEFIPNPTYQFYQALDNRVIELMTTNLSTRLSWGLPEEADVSVKNGNYIGAIKKKNVVKDQGTKDERVDTFHNLMVNVPFIGKSNSDTDKIHFAINFYYTDSWDPKLHRYTEIICPGTLCSIPAGTKTSIAMSVELTRRAGSVPTLKFIAGQGNADIKRNSLDNECIMAPAPVSSSSSSISASSSNFSCGGDGSGKRGNGNGNVNTDAISTEDEDEGQQTPTRNDEFYEGNFGNFPGEQDIEVSQVNKKVKL